MSLADLFTGAVNWSTASISAKADGILQLCILIIIMINDCQRLALSAEIITMQAEKK